MTGSRVQDFVSCFHDQWVQDNNVWFAGAVFGYPVTNKGLESNSWIKRAHTSRERLSVVHFLRKVGELLMKWLEDRNPSSVNYISFYNTPLITLKLWTNAYHWALEDGKVLQRKGRDHTRYFTAATGNAPPDH